MTKYRVYIDEVGSAERKSETNPQKRYLSLTGVIFRVDYAQRVLHHDLNALKTEHLYHHPAIPHRNQIEGATQHFRRLREGDNKQKFLAALHAFLSQHTYRTIIAGLDKFRHFEKYKSWKEDPYHFCLFNVLDRYFLLLQERGGVGDVYVESRNKPQDDRLRNAYSDFYRHGTQGGAFKISAEDVQRRLTSKKPSLRTKPHNVPGLQVADAVAGTLHNHLVQRHGDHDLRTAYDHALLPVLLDHKVHRHHTTKVTEGFGLVWRPR